MKYEELSNEIIEAVGGKQNIVSLQVLKEETKENIYNVLEYMRTYLVLRESIPKLAF